MISNLDQKGKSLLNTSFSFLKHEGFVKYFKNISWMFLSQVLSLVISFVVGAWLARYLGPKNYGLINYSLAFVGLFSFLGYLGVDTILNRELVSNPEKRDSLIGTSFVLKLFGGILAFVFVAFSAFTLNHDSLTRILMILMGVSFLFQTPFVITAFFQSQIKSKENFKAQTIGALISSVLRIFFILFSTNLKLLAVIYMLDSLWHGLFLFFFYKKQGLSITKWKFDKYLAKKIWHDSWPLMLSSAATFVYLKIDQVFIGRMMNEVSVGIYAVAVKVTEIFYFIPNIVCLALFPAIINAKKTNEIIYKKRLKNFYFLLGILGLLNVLFITIVSKFLIYKLFGYEYVESIHILRFYIWSSVGFFLGTGVTYYLVAENMTRTVFLINTVAMVVNIILNIVLIPIYGLIGATVATLISYLILPVFMFFLNLNKKK